MSAPKQVEVTITLSKASYIEVYCTKNGKYTNVYNGISDESQQHTFTVDAGSCFVVYVGESGIKFSSLANCKLMVEFSIAKSPLGIFAADA